MKQVLYRKFTGMTVDAMGNDVAQHADPVEVDAFSWSVRSKPNLGDLGNRDGFTGRNIEDVDLTVVPMDVGVQDQFIIDDGQPFYVVGITDCRNGWHGWAPGVGVHLQRVTG